jgi:translation factor ATP22
MEFKGPKNCVPVLKYMAKHQLEISFSALLVMMKQLRKRGTFEDVLLVVNSINLGNLTIYERKALVHEVLLLIKGRYPTSPKILIGYCASIFNGAENSCVKLLNDLQLLGITHGTGELGTISNLDSIQKANIDAHLTGFELTHTALANVYETIFSSMQKTEITTDLIRSMYDSYIAKVEAGDFTDLNDRVINKFISFLLRVNPGKKEYKFYKDEERYQMAKKIFSDFNDKVWLNRVQRTASLFGLLIYVGLKYHHDVAYSFELAKLSRKLHIPPSFNLIFPFIQYHYHKQEYKYAELWYSELTRLGVRATSRSSKELFRIARELKWDVSGFVYRKLQIQNNYKTKEELKKLDSDPIRLIRNQDTEERVTEELISEPYDLNDIEFSNELVAVLNSTK